MAKYKEVHDKQMALERMEDRNEKMGKRIREAELQKVPAMLVMGDKDIENRAVSVRKRGEGDLGAKSLEEVISLFREWRHRAGLHCQRCQRLGGRNPQCTAMLASRRLVQERCVQLGSTLIAKVSTLSEFTLDLRNAVKEGSEKTEGPEGRIRGETLELTKYACI